MKQICLGFCKGDRGWAEDLTQETFVQVWRALARFEGRSEAKTWVYRIAVNTCLQDARRKRNKPELVFADPGTPEPPRGDESRPNPRIEQLYTAIGQLSELDRLIISLTLNELSYTDISAVTGISPGALRVRTHRLREKLRQLMTDHA